MKDISDYFDVGSLQQIPTNVPTNKGDNGRFDNIITIIKPGLETFYEDSRRAQTKSVLAELNKAAVARASAVVGYQVSSVPVRAAGTEMVVYDFPDRSRFLDIANGKYVRRDGLEEILLLDFSFDISSGYTQAQLQTVVHEYGHKIYRDDFSERVSRILKPGDVIFASNLDEGFAYWFADVALGQKPRETPFSDAYLDPAGIAEVYRKLHSISQKRGVKFVLDHFRVIAMVCIAEMERQRQQYIDSLEPLYKIKRIITNNLAQKT